MGDTKPGDVLAEFYSQLDRLTLQAVCMRRFVLVSPLLDWFKNSDKYSLIRAGCGLKQEDYLPDGWEKLDQYDCLVLVFSLLLDVGRDWPDLLSSCGALLTFFCSQAGEDDRDFLPLLHFKVERLKEKVPTLTDVNRFQGELDQRKWKYCPAKLTYGDSMTWEEDIILPLLGRESVPGTGGTASLHYIFVPEDLISEDLRSVASQTYEFEPKGRKIRVSSTKANSVLSFASHVSSVP